MDRRSFLRGGLALGCSAAAMPLISHATFAAAPWDNRLIVVILRGAMDGLDVVRPVGAPQLTLLRPDLITDPGLPLDNFNALHPALADLLPLWQAGELGFVQAVSTPYRDRRSHFDGQDLLEAGTGMDVPPGFRRDGWLNRMLQTFPGIEAETAFAVGREALPVLDGAAPVQRWAPDTQMRVGAQAQRLLERLYGDDQPFHAAASTALTLSNALEPMQGARNPLAEIDAFAAFSAARLRAETRIVALSLSGWDTHANQTNSIRRPLERLQRLIVQLRAELGPVWQQTAFLAMTEFGRTVRQNGSGGTDHGTGGAMITAGGAIRGGRVLGRWPGLGDGDLYADRDLMPTGDVRAVAGWVMRDLFGLDRGTLEGTVFPGLDLGTEPGILRG